MKRIWTSSQSLAQHKSEEVPRGVEHHPVADEEVSVMLFEPTTTRNTGNTTSELTKAELDRI